MDKHKYHFDRRLMGTLFFVLLLSGCVSSANQKSSAHPSNEEAYIDLKLSFSIVIPVSWKRLRMPVSSPAYRPNLVQWDIPGQTGTENRLQIYQLPLADNSTALAHYMSNPETSIAAQAKSFNYPFGPALKIEKIENGKKKLYIATSDREQSFILSFQVLQSDYPLLEPAIENAISSFSSLESSSR